jgi:hypothetical protein
MSQDGYTPTQATDYEWEVALTDGTKLHPHYAVIKDNGYVIADTDGAKHYFPPHRVHSVSKQLRDE